MHNVYNSLAAIAVGFELEVPFDKIVEGAAQLHRRGPPVSGKGEVRWRAGG